MCQLLDAIPVTVMYTYEEGYYVGLPSTAVTRIGLHTNLFQCNYLVMSIKTILLSIFYMFYEHNSLAWYLLVRMILLTL